MENYQGNLYDFVYPNQYVEETIDQQNQSWNFNLSPIPNYEEQNFAMPHFAKASPYWDEPCVESAWQEENYPTNYRSQMFCGDSHRCEESPANPDLTLYEILQNATQRLDQQNACTYEAINQFDLGIQHQQEFEPYNGNFGFASANLEFAQNHHNCSPEFTNSYCTEFACHEHPMFEQTLEQSLEELLRSSIEKMDNHIQINQMMLTNEEVERNSMCEPQLTNYYECEPAAEFGKFYQTEQIPVTGTPNEEGTFAQLKQFLTNILENDGMNEEDIQNESTGIEAFAMAKPEQILEKLFARYYDEAIPELMPFEEESIPDESMEAESFACANLERMLREMFPDYQDEANVKRMPLEKEFLVDELIQIPQVEESSRENFVTLEIPPPPCPQELMFKGNEDYFDNFWVEQYQANGTIQDEALKNEVCNVDPFGNLTCLQSISISGDNVKIFEHSRRLKQVVKDRAPQ